MDKKANIYLKPHPIDAHEEVIINITGYYEHIKHHQITRQGSTCADEAIFIYCLEGAGWLTTGNKTYDVDKGMAIFCDQKAPHAYGSNGLNPWTILWVHFTGPFVDYFSNALHAKAQCTTLSIGYHTHIVQYMKHILKLLDTPDEPLKRRTAYSYLKVCLCEVLMHVQENRSKNITANAYVDQSILIMEQYLHHSLSLDELCHAIGLSKYYFSRQFKLATGLPPMTYFNRLKIQKASHLLVTTDDRIQEISAHLGFSNPYYFSETFKQFTGFSPREYKHMHGKKY